MMALSPSPTWGNSVLGCYEPQALPNDTVLLVERLRLVHHVVSNYVISLVIGFHLVPLDNGHHGDAGNKLHSTINHFIGFQIALVDADCDFPGFELHDQASPTS